MKFLTATSTGFYRRAIAVLAAVVMVATMLTVAGAPKAEAANRDWLRPDANGKCDWDPVKYWVQRCDVWSASMGRTVPVQIQPAKRGGNAALYLLDGLRATERTNAWVNDVNAARLYEPHNITLVMPIGGEASFYADWDGPAKYDLTDPVNYQWETFLTKELKGYLQRQFGVSPTNNSIAGLSMGGTAAITLAGKYRDQFRQTLSYSGYLATTIPGAQTLMRLALLDAGGFNLNAMYGSIISPRRFENDPFNQIENLRGTDVYISAGSGIPSPSDANYPWNLALSGAALEAVALGSTRIWDTKARALGVNFTANYPATGIHNWNQFGSQLSKTKNRVLDVMNAW